MYEVGEEESPAIAVVQAEARISAGLEWEARSGCATGSTGPDSLAGLKPEGMGDWREIECYRVKDQNPGPTRVTKVNSRQDRSLHFWSDDRSAVNKGIP